MPYLDRVVLLPAGSHEFHGTELPPDTDTVIATAVAASLAKELTPRVGNEATVLPAITYGLSSEHVGLPNTVFVSHVAYYTFVMQLIESISAEKTVCVVVNGHGGNANTLAALEADFNYAHRNSKVFVPALFSPPVKQLCRELFGEFDAHAGSVEASLIAFYQGLPAREYRVELPKRVRGSFRFLRTSEMAPHGVIKQLPRVIADPLKGSRVHEAIVADITESVLGLITELDSVLPSTD